MLEPDLKLNSWTFPASMEVGEFVELESGVVMRARLSACTGGDSPPRVTGGRGIGGVTGRSPR
jgi:DNA-directed RNA polymerase beta subunit